MYHQSHPWHGISPGKEVPLYVNCIIEIPKGSKGKYEIQKESGLLELNRVLFSAVHYPANYGFIPQTYCDDRDPLDVLVICSIDVYPMCVMEAKVIGAMLMIDNKEEDAKIIAVARNDMSVNHINDLSQMPPHTLLELTRFFEDYKKLENKDVRVEKFSDEKTAYSIINDSIERYQKNKGLLIKNL
jgi:inorganic pyrophosphatase